MDHGADEREGGPCPDCGAPASVTDQICSLCLADLGEHRADLPSVDPVPTPDLAPTQHVLRFSDVVAELQVVVDLAASGQDGGAVAAAGSRAGRLLESLSEQFRRDLGLPVAGPAGSTSG